MLMTSEPVTKLTEPGGGSLHDPSPLIAAKFALPSSLKSRSAEALETDWTERVSTPRPWRAMLRRLSRGLHVWAIYHRSRSINSACLGLRLGVPPRFRSAPSFDKASF